MDSSIKKKILFYFIMGIEITCSFSFFIVLLNMVIADSIIAGIINLGLWSILLLLGTIVFVISYIYFESNMANSQSENENEIISNKFE